MIRQTSALRTALLITPLLLAACTGGGSGNGGDSGSGGSGGGFDGTGNGSVSLNWQAPTRNAGNLAAYKVYFGPSSNGLQYWERISAADTNHQISGLTSGTWLFSVTAVNSTGHESLFSNEAVAVIN